MATVTVTNSWPVTLPLPHVNFQGTSDVATLHSPIQSGRHKTRQRFTMPYASARLTWNFTKTEYEAFVTYHEDTLGNGKAGFKIELRYPNNNSLTEWIVRFLGDIDVEIIDRDAIFKTSVQAQLIRTLDLPDKSATVLNFFYVAGTDSDGLPAEQFYVVDDDTAGGTEAFTVL